MKREWSENARKCGGCKAVFPGTKERFGEDPAKPGFGMPRCLRCEEERAARRKEAATRYASDYRNRRRAADPRTWSISRRASRLRMWFGMELADFERLLAEQNGVCRICGNPETWRTSNAQAVRPLSVDHCHASGKVRGLLCAACNNALGQFKDNESYLQEAVKYLRRARSWRRSTASEVGFFGAGEPVEFSVECEDGTRRTHTMLWAGAVL